MAVRIEAEILPGQEPFLTGRTVMVGGRVSRHEPADAPSSDP